MKTRHLVQIGATANIFEWYEFCISAYLAVIMGHLFFNSHSDFIAILQSFSLFAISYLLRPLGSIIFGNIADKYNIGISLKYSMILMTVPTFLIGLLPTYTQVGYFATILLLLLRIIQGFAAGGELPLSASYVYSFSKDKKNSILLCSLVCTSSLGGVLLASFIVFLLHSFFSELTIMQWAWRLPFLLGLPMSLIIFSLRKNITLDTISSARSLPLDCSYLLVFAKGMALVAFMQTTLYIIFLWMPTYLEVFLHVSHAYARISNVISLATLIILTIFFGYIGIYVNYKKLMLFGISMLTILSYPLFIKLHTSNFIVLILVLLIFSVLLSIIEGGFIVTLGSFFNDNIINRGISISWTFSSVLFGSTSPLLCSYMIHTFKYTNFPGIYLTILGLFALFSIII